MFQHEIDYIWDKAYQQGKADGYSQAEKDYFAQSQKDREDTYNCGYAIGRADAIDEVENALDELDTFCDNDHWTSDGSMMWKIHEVRQILEQLKEQKNE